MLLTTPPIRGGSKLTEGPLHAILLPEPVRGADPAAAELSVLHPATWARQVDVEVHAVNAGAGVVLDTQVNVLSDAEAKAAIASKVLLAELVLLHLGCC